MVRLKDKYYLLTPFFFSGFNSLMVRLKADTIPTQTYIVICFNSLMVRLKGPDRLLQAVNHQQFQFPNGSIKSSKSEK